MSIPETLAMTLRMVNYWWKSGNVIPSLPSKLSGSILLILILTIIVLMIYYPSNQTVFISVLEILSTIYNGNLNIPHTAILVNLQSGLGWGL